MLISSRNLSVYGKIGQNLGSALAMGTVKILSTRSELQWASAWGGFVCYYCSNSSEFTANV